MKGPSPPSLRHCYLPTPILGDSSYGRTAALRIGWHFPQYRRGPRICFTLDNNSSDCFNWWGQKNSQFELRLSRFIWLSKQIKSVFSLSFLFYNSNIHYIIQNCEWTKRAIGGKIWMQPMCTLLKMFFVKILKTVHSLVVYFPDQCCNNIL